ncbi:MAG: Ig-like domain-containing protein, partial [Muribaculaceae bacterium]|nr:Ig-like domain-containing protein [Muribaculaceae bacterium]
EDPGVVADIVPTATVPENMAEVQELSKFEFTFSQDIYLKADYGDIVISDMSGENTYNATLSVSADKRTLICTPQSVVKVMGTYHVVIQSGTIGDEEWFNSGYTKGHTNEDIIPVVKVLGEQEPLVYDLSPLSVTPATDDTEIEEITAIVMNFAVATITYEWGETVVNLTDENGNKITNYFSTYTEQGKTGAFVQVKPRTAITTPGVYKLTIPAGQFGDQKWMDAGHEQGRTNPEINLQWTVVKSQFDVTGCSIKEGDELATVGLVTLIAETPKAEAAEGAVVSVKKAGEVVKSATPKVYNTETSSLIVADFEGLQLDKDTEYTLELAEGAISHVLPYSVTFSGIKSEVVEYVKVNYIVNSNAGEGVSTSTSEITLVKGESYNFTAVKPETEEWAMAVDGASLVSTGTYSTGALEADATVTVTYTYTAPVTEYVTVNCKVKTVV